MHESFSHRRDGKIQCAKQGAFSFAAQRFVQLQISAGGCVQRHEFAQAVGAEGIQQVQRIRLGFFEILYDCARRPHGKAVFFQPKTDQRG